MKSTEFSIRAVGIYMIVIPGLGLMAVPEFMLDLFNLDPGGGLWLARMMGLLTLEIGFYFYFIARNKINKLYKWTVVLRYIAAVFMLGMWVAGEVGIMIIMFAAVDAFGATWTLITMKNSALANPEPN